MTNNIYKICCISKHLQILKSCQDYNVQHLFESFYFPLFELSRKT